MIALGIDPSWSATGLAIVEWEPVRGLVAVITHRAIKPLTVGPVYDYIGKNHQAYGPIDVIGLEDAYIAPANISKGIHVAQAGGYCLAAVDLALGQNILHNMQAVEWRRLVLGNDAARLKTESAKKHARTWLSAHRGISIKGMTEHEIEAVAIACAACIKETQKAGGFEE